MARLKKRSRVRSQKRVAGMVRTPRKGYMSDAIEDALDNAAVETGASKSFIIAVALAKFLRVRDQEWL